MEGVQFHPESILTEHGHQLLREFSIELMTSLCRSTPTPTPCPSGAGGGRIGGVRMVIRFEMIRGGRGHDAAGSFDQGDRAPRDLPGGDGLGLMRSIMSGEVSPTLIAAIIIGLRVKKETIGEIAGAAEVMREFATKVAVKDADDLVDIVGTGGDGAHTFNISTAASFVCAAAGARIAKHGNRAVSSKSGSADVLEALGAKHCAQARADRRAASPRWVWASCLRRIITAP